MYQDSDKDPVVKYYDETLAISGKSEIGWYNSKVSEFGGPILDLACGTGRISIFFALKGYSLISLDNSAGMIDIFRKKLDMLSELKSNIQIYKSAMSNFSLNQQFNSILCIDAFYHNLTFEDEENCLKCVFNHLTPSGRFLFNVHNINPKFIDACKKFRGKKWTERKKYWIRNKMEQIVLEQALDIDEAKQLIITLLRFKRYNKKDKLLSLEESKWFSHYRTLDHYKKIIAESGLVIENVIGSYENGPVDENSQLIFQI
jgi:2-polyprenyl-3-methyl-5-hydroxy-6-metoxy-1,4-benzoquinol methylase